MREIYRFPLDAFWFPVDSYAFPNAVNGRGRPAGFPYRNALPAPVHRERCRGFLRKWRRDGLFKKAFARRAKAIDAEYSLAAWVKGLSQPPPASAPLNVEKAIWQATLQELDGIADKYLGNVVYAVVFYLFLGIVWERDRGWRKALLTLPFVLAIEMFQLGQSPEEVIDSEWLNGL